MRSTIKNTIRSISCIMVCICILGIMVLAPLPVLATIEAHEYINNFESDAVSTEYGNFKVEESGENKYLASYNTGFAGTNNLYAGLLGDKIAEKFELSADFMFPAESNGILWMYVKGMSAVDDFQMMDISFIDGVTRVYAQDGGSLGDMPDTSSLGVSVKEDTWHTMKVVKENAQYILYLDEVEVLRYTYENTNNAPTEIYLMQFLTAGSRANFDNFTIRVHGEQVEEPDETSGKPVIIEGKELKYDFQNDKTAYSYGDFKVEESGENKYLASYNTGFAGTRNLYAGQLGDKIAENFELSADFMFPAGSNGILWMYVKGMSAVDDFQMMDISFMDGVTRAYAQDGGSLGDMPDTSTLGVSVKEDTWHTMKVVKENARYILYLDQVEVLRYTYANTDNAPTEIYLMQFLTAGSKSCFDNLTLKVYEKQNVEPEPEPDVTEFANDFQNSALGAAYGDFKVEESDGNRYLASTVGGFAAAGNLYWGALGDEIAESFEVLADFMFPSNSRGILWLYVKGMSAVDDFQMMDVSYVNGESKVYAQDGNMLGENASLTKLGIRIKPDTWHTMKVVKEKSLYVLYVDGVEALRYNYENTDNAPREIYLMQYLTEGSKSCFDNFRIKVHEMNTVGESTVPVFSGSEVTNDFQENVASDRYGDFQVEQGGDNRYLASSTTGFAATSNLYAGELGDSIGKSFEISADFLFPAGTQGIVWLYVKGMSGVDDFQMMDVSFVNDITRVYAQDGDMLGECADTSALGVKVQTGTWHRMKVIKEGALYQLYLDGTEVLHYYYMGTDAAPTEIYLMQYLTAGSKVCFDNFSVKKHSMQLREVKEITLASSTSRVSQGAAVTFSVALEPENANSFSQVKWYVKAPGEEEYRVRKNETNIRFKLKTEALGDYYVYAQIGNVKSQTKYVTVIERKPFKLVDTSSWQPFFQENFDDKNIWKEGTGWFGENADVFKCDGKGRVWHMPGDPKVKVGVAWNGDSFPEAYTIEIDSCIGEGAHGQIWYCLENFFSGENGKWTSFGINYDTDDWYAYVSSDTYGELKKSDDSVNVKELCGGYGKDFTLKMYKYGEGAALYVNDAMVLQWESELDQCTDNVISWINVLSSVAGDTDTVSFDNFTICTDTGVSDTVETVTLTTSAKKTMEVGESILLQCKYYPQTVTMEAVEWYMNGSKIENTGMEYTFTPMEAGSYVFRTVVNGVKSPELKITVSDSVKAPKKSSKVWPVVLAGVGVAAVATAVTIAVVVVKRRKKAL